MWAWFLFLLRWYETENATIIEVMWEISRFPPEINIQLMSTGRNHYAKCYKEVHRHINDIQVGIMALTNGCMLGVSNSHLSSGSVMDVTVVSTGYLYFISHPTPRPSLVDRTWAYWSRVPSAYSTIHWPLASCFSSAALKCVYPRFPGDLRAGIEATSFLGHR